MKLVIDNREIKLIPLIVSLEDKSKYSYSIEVKCLDLGDAILYDDEENEIIVFERKELSDLASSIRDGRYDEQSLRLNALKTHNHNILYIIEGDINKYNSKYSKITTNTLYSTMCSLSYYKGFSVFRSHDIEETSKIIFQYLDKISRESNRKNLLKQPFFSNIIQCEILPENINNEQNITQNNEKKYSEVIKKVKKQNITPDNIGEIILSQIPGISNPSAISIMNHYKSFNSLLDKFRNDENYVLDTLYLPGNKRKINKNISDKIRKYLILS